MSRGLLREKCSNTLLSIKGIFFLKNGQHNFLGFLKISSTYLGSMENLVNIFGDLRKWLDMITPVIKVNESPPGSWVLKGHGKTRMNLCTKMKEINRSEIPIIKYASSPIMTLMGS